MNKVLIVSADSRHEGIRREFEAHGFDIIVARNAVEATLVARTHSPLLIVQSLNLPSTDGMTFCKQLRTAFSHIPVIVFGGERSLNLMMEAYQAGAHTYLADDDEIGKLLSLLAESLRTRARRPATTSPLHAHGAEKLTDNLPTNPRSLRQVTRQLNPATLERANYGSVPSSVDY